MKYETYVELCKELGLSHAPTDPIEASNDKFFKALLERIKKLEKDAHNHSNMEEHY